MTTPGDIFTILMFANGVKDAISDGPTQFRDLCTEIDGLCTLLEDLEAYPPEHMTENRKRRFYKLVRGCIECVEKAKTYWEKYKYIETRNLIHRSYLSIRFSMEDVAGLKQSMQSRVLCLGTFLNGCYNNSSVNDSHEQNIPKERTTHEQNIPKEFPPHTRISRRQGQQRKRRGPSKGEQQNECGPSKRQHPKGRGPSKGQRRNSAKIKLLRFLVT